MAAPHAPPRPAWREFLARCRPASRRCYGVAVALMAVGVGFLLVGIVDDRPWTGPVSWRKPATFGLSFGLTLATVTWATSYVVLRDRLRDALLTVFAIDCVVEVGGVALQAIRGVPSHLNRYGALNQVVALTLAAGGAVLIIVLGRFAVTAFAGRIDATPSMRLALRAGFGLLMVGLLTGAAMIARGTVAMRDGPATRAYEVTGFLKDVHAVTLHGILVLPALAWLLARRDLPEVRRHRIVGLAVTVYVAVAASALLVALITA